MTFVLYAVIINSVMTRAELENFILSTYAVSPDYPWIKYPSFGVFRHSDKKWFCVIMNIKWRSLGVDKDGFVDVVNLKHDPTTLLGVVDNKTIFPAYHMNKNHWISVVINEVPSCNLEWLLDVSYRLT